MTIYVVTSGCYSSYGIEAVFTSEDKASLYCAINHSIWEPLRIEKYETSDDKVTSEDDTIWEFRFYNIRRLVEYNTNCLIKQAIGRYNNRVEIEDRRPVAYVYLDEFNETKAKKIAQDVFAKYKAEIAGIS